MTNLFIVIGVGFLSLLLKIVPGVISAGKKEALYLKIRRVQMK
jgi:hypothetical protein